MLEEVGCQTMAHHIEVRHQAIATYVVDRPIFGMCEGGKRQQGTSRRQWWWEQSMDLDKARALAGIVGAPAVNDDKPF